MMSHSVALADAPAGFSKCFRGGRSWQRTAAALAAIIATALLASVEPARAFSSSKVPTSSPSVSAGGYMTCGVRTDDRAACWGANEGQVAGDAEGPGQAHAPASMTFSEVNAGYSHACGVRKDTGSVNDVKCWGSDYNGASTGTTGSPAVALAACSSTAPCSNPTGAVGMKFRHIAPGYGFTCGLRYDTVTPANDETVACWGSNDGLQVTNVPTGTFTEVTVGIRHACALRKDLVTPANDKIVVCWGSNAYNQSTNAPTYKLKQISSGNFDVCGIKDSDSSVVCWGRNAANQQATTPSGAFVEVSVGFQHACGRRSDGSVACWGRNNELQTAPPAGATFQQVSAGTYHSCGVKTGGTVVCWGDNARGRVEPTMTSLPPVPVAQVANPYSHAFTTTYMSTSNTSSAITWTATGLPPGIALSPTGPAQVTLVGETAATWAQTATLSGVPTTFGAYAVTVTASNGAVSVSQTFPIVVLP